MRIGIDLNTIREINDVNPGLGLKIEELQEIVDTTNNTHFKALVGLIHHNGKLYDNLLKQPNGFETARQARSYLLQNHTLIDASGKELEMPFIEWLRNYRIELNTILAQTNAELLWNWIKWKRRKTTKAKK